MAWEALIPAGINLISDWYRGKEQKEAISDSTAENIAAQKYTADLQYKAQTEAAALQEKMFQQAIEEARRGNMQSLAALLSGQQFNYDTSRAQQLQSELNAQQQQQQAMSWMLPQKATSMGALQSMPVLQKALGLTPYRVPTSIDTSPSRISTPMPNIDFSQLYNNAYRNQMQQEGLNNVVQSGANQGAYVPMTAGGNIPSMLPGTIPNTAQNASVLPTSAAPTTEQVVQAAAEQGASPEQIKQLIYDFEALDPQLQNFYGLNLQMGDPSMVRTVNAQTPYYDSANAAKYSYYDPTGDNWRLRLSGEGFNKTIPQGQPTGLAANNGWADQQAYTEYFKKLEPLKQKLDRATTLGNTADAARYQDIYNFYTGKGIGKDSTAFTYRPPTPTQAAPTAPVTTPTLPQASTQTGTPNAISDFLTSEYAKAQTQPSSYNLEAYTPEEAAAIPDFTASPLYKWQLQEQTDAARKRQIAQGMGNSTYGDRELSRVEQALGADERERWVRDQMQMVNIGMGYKADIPQVQTNQANLNSTYGTSLAELFKGQGNNMADLYTKYGDTASNNMQAIGNIYGQSALNQANIYGQGQLAQAAVSPWYNDLGSTLSGLYSNNNRSANTGRNPTNSTYLYNTSNTPLDVANSYAGIPYSGFMY